MKANKIRVKGTEITILDKHGTSYISLTDIIRPFGNEAILYNWLRNKNTIEFLGLWEKLNNPDFKPIEFDRFKNMAGLNRFILSPKQWVTSTAAISKINYRIHTDAIKDNLIPQRVNRDQIAVIYATEADLLNVALFGMTAKEWRELNPDKQGNVRDHAPIEHLVVLSNLESLNAMLISKGITQGERLQFLNETARGQLISLYKGKGVGRIQSNMTKIRDA
jgi:hypothetical protein